MSYTQEVKNEIAYNVNPLILDKNNSFNRNRLYIISVTDKVSLILKDLSVIDEAFNT